MRRLFAALLVLAFSQGVSSQNKSVIARNPEIIVGKLERVTVPLRDFTRPVGWVDVPVRDENGRIWPDGKKPAPFEPPIFPEQQENLDQAIQQDYSIAPTNDGGTANRAVGLNFNGMGYTFVNPPDPTMCAGPNHFIQMINGNSGAYFKIFDKAGNVIVNQTFLDQITLHGGLGDGIAEYDQLANRFLMMEFVNKPENGNQEGLVIAVSQTPDPSGSWFIYFFPYGNTFPDYPKLSVWPDAYYGTTNDFANASAYSGSSAWAFNRAAMLAGSPSATAQRFTVGSTNKHFSMCPVSLQGTTPPPVGTGGLIAYMQDDAWTSQADVDSIGLFEFHVDFSVPANSFVGQRASLATAAYKSDICAATRGRCISQPGSSIALEALHQKIMNQPIYRNFGSYEGIVLSHVVDRGSNISGVRWYELSKTSSSWNINQQSTYTPDNTHRFLPSACYDNGGNIGLVYNVSSSATGVFPGVRYTGRKQCDPLNTMTYSEGIIVSGTAANSSNRYGDYNHVVADPDGVTFWLTAEWNGASTWSTRIASFTLDPCAPTCTNPSGLNASAITTTSATISWGAVSGALSYDVDYKQASSPTWTNAATGTTALSVNLSGLASSTLYDYRVRTNCSGGNSSYSTAQFTTATPPPPCGTPVNLQSTNITATGATIGWDVVANAVSYDVDYKLTSSQTWTNAATATPSNSVNLTNLAPNSQYDWRVRANCNAGSGSYTQAQFTTQPACPTPTGLNATNITENSATISWNPVSGAISYDADYKIASSSTWINAATGTSSTSVNIGSLNASTLYDFRVRATCAPGSGSYAQSQFTTATPPTTCPGPYDVSTNGTISGAATIPLNTDIKGTIPNRNDNDYYRFVITTGGTISVVLSTLPANYQLSLLNSSGGTISSSSNSGNSTETINTTVAAGTFYARVFPKANASSTLCYNLRVNTGTASEPEPTITTNSNAMREIKVYPNPVTHTLFVSLSGFKGSTVLLLHDITGRLVMSKTVYSSLAELNLSNLAQGTYSLEARNSDGTVNTIKVLKY